MVTTHDISPEDFRVKRLLAKHKQGSLAAALHCSKNTLSNFERKKTDAMYSVQWADVVRELKLSDAQ